MNKENDISYPDMINDFSEDIDCKKLFDYFYYRIYLNHKNNKQQTNDRTNYERDERNYLISNIEHQPGFLNKNGKVSSSKFIDYIARFLVCSFHPDHNLSERELQREYSEAVKIIVEKCESEKKKNTQDFDINQKNNDSINYQNIPINNSQTVQPSNNDSMQQIPEKEVIDFYPFARKSYRQQIDVPTYHRNTDASHGSKNADHTRVKYSDDNVRNSKSHRGGSKNQKTKRKIKGVKKFIKRFWGPALAIIVGSLTVGGIRQAVYNNNLINNTTYQVSQENSISPSMYLSNSGDKNSLLRSPMFDKKSIMFSDNDEFDNYLLKLYTNNGNCGIDEYISQKLGSGEVLYIKDMENLAKANKVFSLSVMQDEFINSLGNKKNSEIKYAKYKIHEDDGTYTHPGDYEVSFYNQYNYQVGKVYFTDKYVSQYIKDSDNYFSQIDEKFEDINKKIKENPNYEKTFDYYNDLESVFKLIDNSFEETNTFALRNHQKSFGHIISQGVDFNSEKGINGMKIQSNNNHDDYGSR